MYLSKIEIHSKLVRNPYLIHKTLWRLFSGSPEQKRDFLFRIEKQQFFNAEILLQSEREPEQINNDSIALLASKAFRPVFNVDQRLRFLVICNPVKKISDELGRKNAKGEIKKCRVPLIREDEQINWIKSKLEDAAALQSIDVQLLPPFFFRKKKEDRSGKIQPIAVRGILSVIQPDAFFMKVRSGIGPAKAFGCGLLSLARI